MKTAHIKINGKWEVMPDGTDAATWLHMGVMVGFLVIGESDAATN